MFTLALITANSDTFGKAIKLQLWNGDEPDERATFTYATKGEAMNHVRRIERQQRSRITIESTL